jgi:hypothetical protein
MVTLVTPGMMRHYILRTLELELEALDEISTWFREQAK